MKPRIMWAVVCPPSASTMNPPRRTKIDAINAFCESADNVCYLERKARAHVWPQSNGKLSPLYARTWRRWYDKGWRAVKVEVRLMEGEE